MACPEPTDSGGCLVGLWPKEMACGPGPGCGADLAFNRAAFARASPRAVRRILILAPLLAWAVALSLRRMALRRATLREDGGWAGTGKGAVAVAGDLSVVVILTLAVALSLILGGGSTPFATPWGRRVAGAKPLFPAPLLDPSESVAAEDGSTGASQLVACC